MKPNCSQHHTQGQSALAYYEIDTPLIALNSWPATLIELALNRGIAEHKLLRNTGIFCDQLAQSRLICPAQALQLIRNCQQHLPNRDLSFLLGNQLFNSNIQRSAQPLIEAPNLQAALEYLLKHQPQLSPLLGLRMDYNNEHSVIYWHDSCGAQDCLIFLVEMMSAALNALCNWRAGRSLPWQFSFAHSTPDYSEQYQVHLDGALRFHGQSNSMSIASSNLFLPWPGSTMENTDYPAIDPVPHRYQQGFLTAVYVYLHQQLAHNPSLEKTANAFGMSSASFKRKLKKHHSHFQAQYDLVRRDMTLYWLGQEGWSNEQLARHLHFHDTANLRRAVKKWTGLTPQELRS